jgi:PKD repeat protein
MKRSLIHFLLALAGLLALPTGALAQAASAPGARPHPGRAPFPQITLQDRKSHGQRAIDQLGNRLPEVSTWYGKTPEEFRRMLLRDRRLKIDQRGRMFVEEELDAPVPAGSAPSAASGALTGALEPLDQTFLLHSRPGASRTIYLNFKGATLAGTAWNGSATAVTALPFDLDGIPYSFNTTELQRIQYMWQRVVEDYAPFDVDVTTEAPPADRLTRSGASDQVFGTTVVVTSRSGVYSCSCGGVAYIGVFDDTTDYYKPALVFYDALGAGNEKYVAEAISHEAGHNMGLLHDGSPGGAYYAGQGSGPTGWAPIMGVGYYQSLVQWSKGEYATANNLQDDYAVMAGNGLPFRPDDHGGTPATATVLVGTTAGGLTALAVTGVIERPGDIDMFAFTGGAGAMSFSVSPAARSPNLDALVELRDGAGNLLASANPVDALGVSLSYNAALPGTYYLSVQGTGKGDPLTTGYSNYGSLGQYAVAGTVPAAAGQAPTAIVAASPSQGVAPLTVAFTSAGSADPDGTIVAYEWTFGDGTSTASGATASHVYTTSGSFTAQLKVTDNSGLSATRSVAITATAPVAVPPMRVADIGMSLSVQKNGTTQARATVTVRDGNGNPLPGATVNGTWSGVIGGSAKATTGSSGSATMTSPGTRSRGTFVFTVTGVSLPGYEYQSALNTETTDSITR